MTPPETGRHSFFDDAPTEVFDKHDMPTDPSMRIPLNRAPRNVPPEPRYQDLVVPRVFVEPDEQMDQLRQQSLRWAIWRDRLAVIVLLFTIGWITRPAWIILVEWLQ